MSTKETYFVLEETLETIQRSQVVATEECQSYWVTPSQPVEFQKLSLQQSHHMVWVIMVRVREKEGRNCLDNVNEESSQVEEA
jgi:hypothetical protein